MRIWVKCSRWPAVLDGERFFVPLRRLRKTRRHRFAMATSTTTISRRINTGFVALPASVQASAFKELMSVRAADGKLIQLKL